MTILSSCRQIRYRLRIPVRRMGIALFPFLLDVATTLPSPLFPCPLLRDPALLRRLRFHNIIRQTEGSPVYSSRPRRIRRLDLVLLQPSDIRLSLDKSEVRRSEMAQDLGFLLVSWTGYGVADCSDGFLRCVIAMTSSKRCVNFPFGGLIYQHISILQYSDYSNVGYATPTTLASATGAAPVGGGREGIVVDVPPVNIDTTSAGGGQPEPGHDVFAKEPEKQIESKPGSKDDNERQISTVKDAAMEVDIEDQGVEEVDGEEAEIARSDLFADA